jgi:hypothetical protein
MTWQILASAHRLTAFSVINQSVYPYTLPLRRPETFSVPIWPHAAFSNNMRSFVSPLLLLGLLVLGASAQADPAAPDSVSARGPDTAFSCLPHAQQAPERVQGLAPDRVVLPSRGILLPPSVVR